MTDSVQQGAPPLWAVALDKMRDYHGYELSHDVTLTSSEAIAFVRHYLRGIEEAASELAEAHTRFRSVLKEIHANECGCDRPGNSNSCTMMPLEAFAVLGEE